MEFLAKSDGTSLKQHSINVANKTINILCKSGVTNKEYIDIATIAAILHDCGKTSPTFQNYLNEQKEDAFSRHNEIGFALMNLLIDKNYGFYNKNEYIDYVTHTVLYHHSPFNTAPISLGEIYHGDIEKLKNIADYYNEIFEEFKLTDVIRFTTNIDEDDIDNIIIGGGERNLYGFIDTGNIGFALKQLKIFDIIFNAVRYADYVVSGGIDIDIDKKRNDILTMPSHFDKDRWDEQSMTADKAYSYNTSIIDATMGWGKTSCGVRYLLKTNDVGFWVCPDNKLSFATYENITQLLRECGNTSIKVALLLSGSWQDNNWGGSDITINDADIIVTNIDTCLNGIFRNRRKDISYKMLFSNCIFDEFHEYAFTNEPLLSRFLGILSAKKELSNVKTLLLSGTVINKGYVDVEHVITAGENLAKQKKVRLHQISLDEYINNYSNIKDSLLINTSISTCQNRYEDNSMDYCFHSEFDEKDSKNIISDIMSHNGKYANNPPSTVSSTSIFSRGMDVSFSNSFVINPSPLTPEQLMGRTGNRWDFETVGDLYIVLSDNRNELFIYDDDTWKKYYKPYINYLKSSIKNGETITAFDLKNLRKNFFENAESTQTSFKKLIRNNLRNSLCTLSKIFFTDGSAVSDKKNDVQHIKDDIDIRGNSVSRFFTIQIDDASFGTMTGPINMPYYRFGQDRDFNSLKTNTNLFNNIKRYFTCNKDIAKKYKISVERYRKPSNLISVLLEKAKCSDTPFPLLCDYHYNNQKGPYR